MMDIATRSVTIGTRGSALARWQTDHVASLLRAIDPDLTIETQLIITRGDRELDKPLPEIGGKGLFTAELEAALLSGEIDLAVHSLKDLPTETAPGLMIGAIPLRAAPGDVLVSRHGLPLAELPAGARIGTSSLRRASQILQARPDAEIVSLRGNVDTRLRKAQTDDYDAIILAAAGLQRLGLEVHVTEYLPLDVMLPAPGQGALAIHCRSDDSGLSDVLAELQDEGTSAAVTAERAFLSGLGGGCSVPVAAYGQAFSGELTMQGLVASPDGSQAVRVTGSIVGNDDPDQAEALGERLAQEAIAKGAARLLESAA